SLRPDPVIGDIAGMREPRPAAPGQPLYADDINMIVAEVLRQARMQVEGGELQQAPGGPLLSVARGRPGFWARITQVGSGSGASGSGPGCKTPNAFVEVEEGPCGSWVDRPNGRSGTLTVDPAYEVNNVTVAVGTVVWMWRGTATISGAAVSVDWRFWAG